MDIEKALRQYQKTKDFSDDCQRKKTELFADFHVLPDDLTIERMVMEDDKVSAVVGMVLEEKRKELEERRESV